MDCRECRKLLFDFLEDRLDRPRRRDMRAHLQTCSECSTRVGSLTRMAELMKGLYQKPRQDESGTPEKGILPRRLGMALLFAAAFGALLCGSASGEVREGPEGMLSDDTAVKEVKVSGNQGLIIQDSRQKWLMRAADYRASLGRVKRF